MKVHPILALCFALALHAETTAQKPLKVSMYSFCEEYHSVETLPALKAFLEEKYQASCDVHQAKDARTLPGLDDLESADVIVIFCRRMTLPENDLAKIRKYCEAGKGVVGIRTASHAFQGWLEMDKVVYGGDYHDHYNDNASEVSIEEKGRDHPILAGIQPFQKSRKLYKNPKLADDATVLLTASNGQGKEPVAWVHPHHGGRAFYTSLGVPEDFAAENFKTFLANAIFWVAGRAPVKK